jgi:poly-gamma-glutamate capsule biosynthesis protein CapA/YwtB (metallophosphatase superfamily)
MKKYQPMPVHPFGPNMTQTPMRPQKKSSKKYLLWILLAIFLAAVSLAGLFVLHHKYYPPVVDQAEKPASQVSTNTDNSHIRLLAAGDFVYHDSINANAKQDDGSYDYLQFMSDFQPIFKAADIRFCNQVTLIGGAQYGVSGYPKFNAPFEAIHDMNSLGCNLINMASNHSFNKTQAAISSNVAEWSKQKDVLAAAGQNRSSSEKNTVHYFTTKGVKFAFLAYTTYINNDSPAQNDYGVSVYSRKFAKSQIDAAKKSGAQIIIVSMRWGTEYSPNVNAKQKTEAQYLADQGVSLVLGHGTHVLQPVAKLKGTGGNSTVVWYGLGNFLNMQLEPEALFNGLGVVDFDARTHEITNLGFLPFYMSYTWTPDQSAKQALDTRKNPHMYLLENATQTMIDAQQLNTTVKKQVARLTSVLSKDEKVPILSSEQFLVDKFN